MKQVFLVSLCLLLFMSAYAQENPAESRRGLMGKSHPISWIPSTDELDQDVFDGENSVEGDDDDDQVEVHSTLYFVMLDPNEDPDTIEALKEILNSEEVWFRPEINLRLWNVEGFPYTDSLSGIPVSNIQGQVTVAKSKTKITDAGYNVVDINITDLPDVSEMCFDLIDFNHPQGQTPVKISILDTGIGNLFGYNDPNYSFELTEYEGYDYIHNDNIPDDEHGHGTGVAGLIYHITEEGSRENNVTFDIRKTHDATGQGLISHIIPAILDAVNEGANIINMSFSYLDYRVDTLMKPLQLAIAYAESQGVLLITAAGNDGFDIDHNEFVSFPAAFQNEGILTVASGMCNMDLSLFSSYGASSVDIVVLGEHIPVPNIQVGTLYAYGTSYSCALTSGMAAILATWHSNFEASTVKCVLMNSAIYNSNLSDKVVTKGYIDYETSYSYNSQGCGQSNESQQIIFPTYVASSIAPTLNNGQFTIRYSMEIRGHIDLRVLDRTGNIVYWVTGFREEGYHELYIDLNRLNSSGPMMAICKTPTKMEILRFVIM